MIQDLDETLRQLLIQKAGLDPAVVDVSFDIPTRDWASGAAATRPTVNLYLYDVRENRQLREMGWDGEPTEDGRMRIKRLPLRIDLSYMVTCWTSTAEDQHRLLWQVMETFFRHSPLPEDLLQGNMRQLTHPVRTEVAQPDGVLKNVSDFWGALENQLRPAVTLTVTLDLDLAQIRTPPLVFARVLRHGWRSTVRDAAGHSHPVDELDPGWEPAPLQVGGVVRTAARQPVAGAAVRLLATGPDGPEQFGPTVITGADGRYLLSTVPAGRYTLVVEVAGRRPQQQPLTVEVPQAGQKQVPELLREVEVE